MSKVEVYKNPNALMEDRIKDLVFSDDPARKDWSNDPNRALCCYSCWCQRPLHQYRSMISDAGKGAERAMPSDWADMVDRFQQAALDSRLGIPLIYMVTTDSMVPLYFLIILALEPRDLANLEAQTTVYTAINAGIDMVMVPRRYNQFVEDLTPLEESREIQMSRIDDAVERILRVKLVANTQSEACCWSF
ncbi:hypothetical protein REPUB_Repub11eG0152700 [Reevesia pubescens]